MVRVIRVGEFDGGSFREKGRQFHIANAQRRAFSGQCAFALHDFDHDMVHIRARRSERISARRRDRMHFANHRKDIFLEVSFIPQNYAEGMGSNVRHLDQAAFPRGKLLACPGLTSSTSGADES